MSQIPFTELNISQELQRAIREMGFEEATEIQAEAIPLILAGHDMIGRSQTGTGKTAAFVIPAVELTDGENKTDVQVLVICPTRELAMQSWGEFKKIYKYKSGVKAAAIYGGQHIDRQICELKKGVNVVIGTPGRIIDHLRRKTLKLGNLRMVVLDEADEMLDMGFRDDIETILNKTPGDRQTILFSATMPPEILAITQTYQKQPRMVEVSPRQVTLPAIKQYYCEVPAPGKSEAVVELLKRNDIHKAIVFCNTQRMVDVLCRYLNQNGQDAVAIHGGMRQNDRTQVMKSFKTSSEALLVATDVAARGIDAQDVEAVINFDLPTNTDDYIHRIGRTGRAGKEGMAFTIACSRSQVMQLHDIERTTRAEMILQEIPLAGKRSDEISAPQRSVSAAPLRSSRSARPDAAKPIKGVPIKKDRVALKVNMAKIVLNLGKEQHIEPGRIVKSIAERTSLSGSDIGKIQVLDKSTIVEVPDEHRQEVIDAMNGSKMIGLFVEAQLSDSVTKGNQAAPGNKKSAVRSTGNRQRYGSKNAHEKRRP